MKLTKNISHKIDEFLKSLVISKVAKKKTKISHNDLVMKIGYVNLIITMLIVGFLIIIRK